VVARHDGDGVGARLERGAQLVGARVLEPRQLGVARAQRGRRLVGEIAGSQQEDAP
jgi:hypothetical protein